VGQALSLLFITLCPSACANEKKSTRMRGDWYITKLLKKNCIPNLNLGSHPWENVISHKMGSSVLSVRQFVSNPNRQMSFSTPIIKVKVTL